MKKLIHENIAQHIELTAEDLRYLEKCYQQNAIKRNQILLRQDEICRKIFFVEKGSLRAYNINEKGKEFTVMFAIANWWITDMDAFVNTTSSSLSIVALENTEIVSFDHMAIEKLFSTIPKFERYFRILFQNAYIREQRRAFENISCTTEERYIQFVERYPDIVKSITQKQIASYLGVTPEFLSATKKNIQS